MNQITRSDFPTLVCSLVNARIIKIEKLYGSSLSIRVQLTLSPTRENFILIEWAWRLVQHEAVLVGSSSAAHDIIASLKALQGQTIQSITLLEPVPDIAIAFTNDYLLQTCILACDAPSWSIETSPSHSLRIENGQLMHGADTPSPLSHHERLAFAHAADIAERWGQGTPAQNGQQCRSCLNFVPLGGEGHLLDYGVCTEKNSTFDRYAVHCKHGCSCFVPMRTPQD